MKHKPVWIKNTDNLRRKAVLIENVLKVYICYFKAYIGMPPEPKCVQFIGRIATIEGGFGRGINGGLHGHTRSDAMGVGVARATKRG